MSLRWAEFYRTEAGSYHVRRYGNWYGARFRELHAETVGEILTHVPPPTQVLDCATGTGHMLDSLLAAGHNTIALDLTPEMLAQCRSRVGINAPVSLVCGSAFCLPFAQDRFDVVSASRFLHLFTPAEQQAVLRELLRVLRPGGYLLVDFYNRAHWRLLRPVIGVYRWIARRRPVPDTFTSADEVRVWIREMGGHVEQIRGIGSYLMVLARPLPASWARWLGRQLAAGESCPLAEQFLLVARKPS